MNDQSATLDFRTIRKGNPGGSGYERAAGDWYVEGPDAVRDLLIRETFTGAVHDPACGGGNIVRVCREFGYHASGSDIVDRANGEFQVADFLTFEQPLVNVITNPPYAKTICTDFVIRACTLASGKVAVLQKLVWLEGSTRGRELYDRGWLEALWVFRRRLSLPPGEGFYGKTEGGKIAYAWFVFNRHHDSKSWRGGWIE